MLKRRLQRLVRVYTCQNAILFEISCTGSIVLSGGVGWSAYSPFYENFHCFFFKLIQLILRMLTRNDTSVYVD